MSVEGVDIDLRECQLLGDQQYSLDKTEGRWRGRVVSQSHVNHNKTTEYVIDYPLSKRSTQLLLRQLYPNIRTYGENVDGSVSASAGINTDGSQHVGVDVEVSTKDGNLSGSVSGEVSRDSEGHTSADVEVKGTWNF